MTNKDPWTRWNRVMWTNRKVLSWNERNRCLDRKERIVYRRSITKEFILLRVKTTSLTIGTIWVCQKKNVSKPSLVFRVWEHSRWSDQRLVSVSKLRTDVKDPLWSKPWVFESLSLTRLLERSLLIEIRDETNNFTRHFTRERERFSYLSRQGSFIYIYIYIGLCVYTYIRLCICRVRRRRRSG